MRLLRVTPIEKDREPMHDPGRDPHSPALQVQVDRFQQWETAYLASVLALNTTMRGCEIKQLRWRDIDFMDERLAIRRSKTIAGERVIPLNAYAHKAIMRLRERAQMLFGPDLQPDWYDFPSSEGYSKPDPTRPMNGWRSAWRSLRQTVNVRLAESYRTHRRSADAWNVGQT